MNEPTPPGDALYGVYIKDHRYEQYFPDYSLVAPNTDAGFTHAFQYALARHGEKLLRVDRQSMKVILMSALGS